MHKANIRLTVQMKKEMNDEYFMRLALQEARKAAEEGEVPVGAVIICNGKVIAKGYNQVEKLNDATAHAEMIALTAASGYLGSKFLEACTLYVTIEPCLMCAGALRWTRLGRLVFGASEPKSGFSLLGKDVLHPDTNIEQGVLKEECAALIKDFFKSKRQWY
ncbi:MAG: tRNA adenosine(34) deaminase TadA [Chitinophagales bacterium]|nr:tRNA adenosine(34) deaminase TadA [Chitinophagales bacterium]MDW8274062.1 tRNA adenosine(34) deaminase TadA [Chitinophagales bacterium]